MAKFTLRARVAAIVLTVPLIASACSGNHYAPNSPTSGVGPMSTADDLQSDGANVSVLKQLKTQMVIGSTIDPKFKQLNPYGLAVAPSTAGAFTAGDLVVCNFNAKSNVQGTGFTIVGLHPAPGSKPLLVAASKKTLLGCNALALAPQNFIWAAAFASNSNPILDANGKLVQNITGKPLDRPFGQIYAPAKGKSGPAFYESNAGNGTIVRFNLSGSATEDVIAKGFKVNHGKPGSILGPSGLAYDLKRDTLYIVDGANNTVVAFAKVSTIPAGGIKVEKGGMTFSGPSASLARVVFAGAPLNASISSALLFNGNLVIGNTGDPNGKNLMVEISRSGRMLDVENVDKGPAGSIFGMVATGTSAADTKLYFNDDNDNNLQVLQM
jgi:hypothetical protein